MFFVQARGKFLNTLPETSTLLPKGVFLHYLIDFKRKKGVELSGRSLHAGVELQVEV